MIASLVTILLHHIRYRVLSPDNRGLPLGLITSPFRLLDITYLCSREFWATLRNLGSVRISEVITIVLHLFLFILAAVLGPASAISMLPRLGEWELAKTITSAPFYSIHDRYFVYQAYMGAELSDIFPTTITASLNPEACDHRNLSLRQTNTCPRFGLTDILQGLYVPETIPGSDTGSDGFPPQLWWSLTGYNITIQTHNQDASTRVTSLDMFPFDFLPSAPPDPNFATIVDVTTSTDAILLLTQHLLGHYLGCWDAVMNDDHKTIGSFLPGGERPVQFTSYAGQLDSGERSSPWKQPYVSSFCSKQRVGSTASDSITFTFRQQNDTLPWLATLDSKVLSIALSNTGMAFISSSNLNMTPSYTPSAALAFTSQSSTTLCLVKASWIDFTLSGPQFDLSESLNNLLAWDWDASESDLPLEPFHAEDAWFNHTNATEITHFDLDWLEVLDHGTGEDSTSKHGFFNKVRRACLGSSILGDDEPDNAGKDPDLTCFAAGVGAGIAEGLSKMPYHAGIHALGILEDGQPNTMEFSPWTSFYDSFMAIDYDMHGNWTNSTLTPSQIKTNSTRLDFTLTQKLHGYSFSGVTITLAFVVLFLYVATVLVHISILTFGTSWSSRAWKSLGEFYVLALQSPAPTSVLDNTGGGVKVTGIWQARASVRELQDGNRVGIVVREPSQPDASDDSTSKVRPDWKYS